MKWYRLVAEQGDADAQFNLGLLYKNGWGVPQDYKTAVKWYRLAAEQGHANAQGNLGNMYAYGYGAPQDYIYAYMWTNFSARNGSEWGEFFLEKIEKNMTSAQIAKAKDLARECVRKKYKGC